MLDRFFASHREVVFRDGRREKIWDQGFEQAVKLARADTPLPDRTFINGSRSHSENATFYGLMLRRTIRAHIPKVWRQPDDILLEFVVLCKWLHELEEAKSPELVTARAAIGSMVQKGLTQLLCDIHLDQWWRLHHLGRTEGINRRVWEVHIAGASASAYVLKTLSARNSTRLYFPTTHEDVNQGIDLLWIEGGACHAVSVKCVAGQGPDVLAWYVDQKPTQCFTDRISDDMRRIYGGAHQLATQEERPCHAVLIHVAKPEDGPIRLNRDWERLVWPDQVLRTIRQRREPTLALAPTR